MENYIRVNGTVVSHIGIQKNENNDNFYINGRFCYEHETQNIQVSIDNEETDFLFAVMDSMEKQIEEKNMNLSMPKELRKFHRKIIQSGKGIQVKVEQLGELSEEVSNLIFSGNITESISNDIPSIAGLIIEDNTCMAINYGSTKVFLLRDGNLKKIVGNENQTEKMYKMGILTDEQADVIESDDEIGFDENLAKKSDLMYLREDDMFLLCTDGLSNAVDEEQIFEIMSMRSDTGVIANMLVREAVRNSGEDNITALVIRIDNIEGIIEEETEDVIVPIKMKIKEDTYREDNYQETSIDRLYDDTLININEHIEPLKLKKITKEEKKRKQKFNMIKRTIVLAIAAILIISVIVVTIKWFKSIALPPNNGKDDLVITDVNNDESETTLIEETEKIQEITEETTLPKETDPPVETTIASEWPKEYKVVSGDTLYGIAKKFYNDQLKSALIIEANGITNASHIEVGDILIIPSPE